MRAEIDSVVLRGLPTEALIVESRSASLICVGTGRFAAAVLGSAATKLAEHAHCPVLVAQRPDVDSSSELTTLENTAEGRSWNNLSPRWIALSINGTEDNRHVADHAMREAHLRQLPVLAISTWSHHLAEGMPHELDRRIACLREQYRDVHLYPATTRSHLPVHCQMSRTDCTYGDRGIRVEPGDTASIIRWVRKLSSCGPPSIDMHAA